LPVFVFVVRGRVPKKAVKKLDHEYRNEASIYKALADEIRLEIIAMLREGELCACKIQDRFDISQPTLSYHMKILTRSGFVGGRKDGLWIRYSLKKEGFELARDLLDSYCARGVPKSLKAEEVLVKGDRSI